jgi:hypothetical protein
MTTQEEIEVPTLDLCVMNPPFTRSVGGNLLFGNRPKAEREVMQGDLRGLIARHSVQANVTAGLGSVFGALGHRLLNPGGQLALVLPRALLSGIAWAPTREMLARDYHVRSIVVSHQPGAWNFSENTSLSECLLVARRLAEGEQAGSTTVINLWRKPRNSIDALAVAHQLSKLPGASLDGAGTDAATMGVEKIAEVVLLEADRIRAGRFNEGSAFAQTELAASRAGFTRGGSTCLAMDGSPRSRWARWTTSRRSGQTAGTCMTASSSARAPRRTRRCGATKPGQ